MIEVKNLVITDAGSLLEKIADRLERARYRRDEMSPEDAFSDAIAEIADAIREVAREAVKDP